MHLSSLESPSPDWDLVLVYSDYLEDQGQEVEAQALRWLHQWDHWPMQCDAFGDSSWVWFLDSHPDHFGLTRYFPNSQSSAKPKTLMSTLPPIFNQPRPVEIHSSPCCADALITFFNLFRPIYFDPLTRPSLYNLKPYTTPVLT